MTFMWTPDRLERLHALRATGMLYTDIAKALGTTKGSVIGRARTERNNPSARTLFKWTKERLEQLRKFRAEGLTHAYIASILGTTKVAVASRACFHEIKGRPPAKSFRQVPFHLRDPGPLPNTIPVNLFERTGCAWPVNEGGPFLFCNAMRHESSPYCPHHAVRMVRYG